MITIADIINAKSNEQIEWLSKQPMTHESFEGVESVEVEYDVETDKLWFNIIYC